MRRIRQSFEEQMEKLEQRLLEMGAFVEDMLEKAVRALTEHDVELAREVISADDTADEMDLEIEQDCMRLLALQQPMARDLRTIGTVMKVIADVERIGDYSVDIARTAIRLAEITYFKPLVDIPQMAKIVRGMLERALEALVHHDLQLVHQVIEEDEQVDQMWSRLLEEIEEIMQKHPEVVPQAASLLLVARYLERIADHVVNVAERVDYMETGELTVLAPSHRSDYDTASPDDSAPQAQ